MATTQLNLTTMAPGEDDDPAPKESWIIEFIWLPYVLLGLILIGMALASFIHYHFQNRGKYADKKAHASSKSLVRNPSPSKQTVTLHSRGVVNRTLDPENPDPDPDPAERPPGKSIPKSDMFVASVHSKDTPRGETTSSPDSSVTSTAAYANESYDSNCDSDKSLLSSETSGATLQPSKKRPRSRSPRRRTNSVEPAPPQSPKKDMMRKAKSMDVLQKDDAKEPRASKKSSHETEKNAKASTSTSSASSAASSQGSQGSASTSRCSRMSSPPPSTARLETPVIPDNSRPRTQPQQPHRSRTGEVNVLKIHHEEEDDD